MSGAAEQIDTDRLIFDICSAERQHRKLFVTAWVVIRKEYSNLFISESDWSTISLGQWDDEDTLRQNFGDIEPKNYGVSEPGCYIMRALFDIKTDSDDYRRWEYLEEKIVEFDFMCTIEEHERPETGFIEVDESLNTPDSFNFFNL